MIKALGVPQMNSDLQLGRNRLKIATHTLAVDDVLSLLTLVSETVQST